MHVSSVEYAIATVAMIGTLCGLLADSLSSVATMWILPFTAAGVFIYIATVSVIPDLLPGGYIDLAVHLRNIGHVSWCCYDGIYCK